MFWPDDVSLMDAGRFVISQIRGHQQITDLYLAGLAFRNSGMLATFDTRIPVGALIGVSESVVEIISFENE